jgi:Lon protease-like protein
VPLPEVIPLFPLPNVVLFPYMPLPLHVFEPRYRAMVRDALQGPRLVGMVLLRGDWRSEYGARPPIFTTGTVGQIVHVDELADGRFNIVLRGTREFTIADELPARALYREARVRWREEPSDPLPEASREAILTLVHRYLSRVGRTPTSPRALDRDVGGIAFVNFLAQHLDLEPVEKQALLEETSTAGRGRRLIEVLEFRLLELATTGAGSQGRSQ